ncbi:MAG: hypothetical protein Q7S40_18915 [Opitutaceae bacterium]|nr:hypothetical protein [Opitutaceae bacterium]
MPRPPESIAFIARTHWVMGGVIAGFTIGLYGLLHDSTVLELSRKTFTITIALSAMYVVAGLVVWFGTRGGRALNYICSLLYLARPPLGMRIWKIMRSDEYKAHFRRDRGAL